MLIVAGPTVLLQHCCG